MAVHNNTDIGHLRQLTAAKPSPTDSLAPGDVGVADRAKHILRIAARTDPNHEITGINQPLELLDKHILVADIVRPRSHCGNIIGPGLSREGGVPDALRLCPDHSQ